ncbi:MAG: hypothetical protein WA943_09835 [Parvibaculum sp.]|jgi:hypothetical protein|uniref:hypothetical protein n=1 Tax=Parvibaculum sp. TaxID=2024848 RepID=UPI003C736BAC
MSVAPHHDWHGRNVPLAPDLHPGVFVAAIGGWAWLFGAFWLVFGGQREGAFMMAVDTAFLAVFFGTPYLLKRTADRFLKREEHHGSFADFLHGDVQTWTGTLSGWSALIQVIVVPFSVALGMTAIGFIIASARAQYGG